MEFPFFLQHSHKNVFISFLTNPSFEMLVTLLRLYCLENTLAVFRIYSRVCVGLWLWLVFGDQAMLETEFMHPAWQTWAQPTELSFWNLRWPFSNFLLPSLKVVLVLFSYRVEQNLTIYWLQCMWDSFAIIISGIIRNWLHYICEYSQSNLTLRSEPISADWIKLQGLRPHHRVLK